MAKTKMHINDAQNLIDIHVQDVEAFTAGYNYARKAERRFKRAKNLRRTNLLLQRLIAVAACILILALMGTYYEWNMKYVGAPLVMLPLLTLFICASKKIWLPILVPADAWDDDYDEE